ncbi:MAG: LysE family translocator [Pseudomonadota bacterium]
MFEAYLLTLLGVIAAQASPGPNFVAVISVALAQGRRAGLWVVAGVSTGMLVWSLATAYGLATVLEWFPWSLNAMRILGGGYLLWLAAKGIRAAMKNQPGSVRASKKRLSNQKAYWRGLLVVLTNPKALLMWAAVATFLFGAGLSAGQVLAFGPMGAVSGFMIYGSYSALFSTGIASRTYAIFSRLFEVAFGTAFGALGGKLLFDGIRELRS